MPKRTFYDSNCPDTEHTVRLDRVPLEFGRDGLLTDPRPDQVAAMTADPYRKQRFVEGLPPRSPQQQGAATGKPAGDTGRTPPGSPAGDSKKDEKAGD